MGPKHADGQTHMTKGPFGDTGGSCCGGVGVEVHSFVEPTLQDTLEGEGNELKALARVELVLKLHPVKWQ